LRKLLFFALAVLPACATTDPVPRAPSEPAPIRVGIEMIEPVTNGTTIPVVDYRHVLTNKPLPPYREPESRAVVVPARHDPPTVAPAAKSVAAIQNAQANPSLLSPAPVIPSAPVPSVSQQVQPAATPVPVVAVAQVKQPFPPAAAQGAVDPVQRAWERYCSAGEKMTEEDERIVAASKWEIPEKYRQDCLPPK